MMTPSDVIALPLGPFGVGFSSTGQLAGSRDAPHKSRGYPTPSPAGVWEPYLLVAHLHDYAGLWFFPPLLESVLAFYWFLDNM